MKALIGSKAAIEAQDNVRLSRDAGDIAQGAPPRARDARCVRQCAGVGSRGVCVCARAWEGRASAGGVPGARRRERRRDLRVRDLYWVNPRPLLHHESGTVRGASTGGMRCVAGRPSLSERQ